MSLYSALTQVLAPFAAKIKGIQTGYDGTEYTSPGEAVREQINDLHVLIGDVPGRAISASAISYGDSDVGTELTNVNGRLDEQGANILELQEGGYVADQQQIGAKINAWLNDHPEATTTVQDGSLTEAKFSNALKLKAIKDYVTPEMFGAAGDGTTNDAAAIGAAVIYAKENGLPLVFSNGKTYLTAEPIVIEQPTILLMQGTLAYLGDGVALTIGKAGVNVTGANLTIKVAGKRGGTSFTAGSTGVRLINVNSCNINIAYVERFETGVEFVGNGGGTAYNNICVDIIRSCQTLLKLNAQTGGWVNENKFFGGRFQIYTSDSFKANAVGILITSEISYNNNGNVFYSPCLEQLATCVKIEYGVLNRIYDCRTEGATAVLVVENTSFYNLMSSTYGRTRSASGVNPEDDINLYEDGESVILNKFSNVIFDSGDIDSNCAGNASYISFAKIIHMYGGTVSTSIFASDAEINNGLVVKTNRGVGAIISAEKNKTFAVYRIMEGTCRIGVIMYDANGAYIEDTNPVAYSTKSITKETLAHKTSGALQHGYATGANSIEPLIISLPSNCVKAYIGCFGASSNFTLHRLIIKAINPDRFFADANYDTPILEAVPTSTGKVGQFVKSSSPTSGAIGWIYTGSEWISVG